MKRKPLLWVVLGLLIIFTAVSCKSTPAVDPAALSDLDNAAARAADARKLIQDFDGPISFPSDWAAAEALYTAAQQGRDSSTLVTTVASTGAYTAAAEAFEAMKDETLAQYFDTKEEQLNDARDNAVYAGAQTIIPDFLLAVDNIVADALDKYDEDDYYGAKDDAEEALTRYGLLSYWMTVYQIRDGAVSSGAEEHIPDLLEDADNVAVDAINKYIDGDFYGAENTGSTAESMYVVIQSWLDAYALRDRIIARNMDSYDPDNFQQGDDALDSAIDDFSNGDLAAAKAKIDQATDSYRLTMQNAWQSYVATAAANASAERQKALDAKANVAMRQEFNAAQAIYTQAGSALQSNNYEQAGTLYETCQSLFTDMTDTALGKRQTAEDALNAANQKMAESDEAARNAELILGGSL